MGEKKEYPWLSIRHRLKEVPGVIFAWLSGPHERRRLARIVKRREEQRAQLEKRREGKHD